MQPIHASRLRPLAAALAITFTLAGAHALDERNHAGGAAFSPRTDGFDPIVVANCDDAGPGSLRAAYAVAADGDTLDLTELACSTITLTSGTLTSAPNAGYVMIRGAYGAPVTIDAGHESRVFAHDGARLSLNNVHVVNGSAAAPGGCIYSTGDVALLHSTVSDCEVTTTGATPAVGGAVRAVDTVYLVNSTVSDSRADASGAESFGGGISAYYVISAQQSTISGNAAASDGAHGALGGGVYAMRGVRLDDVTLSGNAADKGGGAFVGAYAFTGSRLSNATVSGNGADIGAGLFANGPVHVFNSTIASNAIAGAAGAGIYLAAGDAELQSTIVANNTAGDDQVNADIGGHAGGTVTGSHNLVLASTLAVPFDTIVADPRLGSLEHNGGGVMTHALLAGSPAIDAGENPMSLSTDARGYGCDAVCRPFERFVGLATDIGAFEFGAPDRLFTDGFDSD